MAWPDSRAFTRSTTHGGRTVTGYPRTDIRPTEPVIHNTIRTVEVLTRTQVNSHLSPKKTIHFKKQNIVKNKQIFDPKWRSCNRRPFWGCLSSGLWDDRVGGLHRRVHLAVARLLLQRDIGFFQVQIICDTLGQWCFSTFFTSRHLWSAIPVFVGTPRCLSIPKGQKKWKHPIGPLCAVAPSLRTTALGGKGLTKCHVTFFNSDLNAFGIKNITLRTRLVFNNTLCWQT